MGFSEAYLPLTSKGGGVNVERASSQCLQSRKKRKRALLIEENSISRLNENGDNIRISPLFSDEHMIKRGARHFKQQIKCRKAKSKKPPPLQRDIFVQNTQKPRDVMKHISWFFFKKVLLRQPFVINSLNLMDGRFELASLCFLSIHDGSKGNRVDFIYD